MNLAMEATIHNDTDQPVEVWGAGDAYLPAVNRFNPALLILDETVDLEVPSGNPRVCVKLLHPNLPKTICKNKDSLPIREGSIKVSDILRKVDPAEASNASPRILNLGAKHEMVFWTPNNNNIEISLVGLFAFASFLLASISLKKLSSLEKPAHGFDQS
eukprot:gnl/MRDRNA2_/MRDRNA2_63933_c0_seq1.p1 gnl/MRDRNA2_/MRDRNA2_63933_c0~~gnl/MRDRNA2_/MRDRNA2_63933_c0_seq1.p1  ORF type:complete len:159 (-),score=13.93 gnl/MRDRNA2_/MRDRNA2_63933_c0_seq1:109-585(-)